MGTNTQINNTIQATLHEIPEKQDNILNISNDSINEEHVAKSDSPVYFNNINDTVSDADTRVNLSPPMMTAPSSEKDSKVPSSTSNTTTVPSSIHASLSNNSLIEVPKFIESTHTFESYTKESQAEEEKPPVQSERAWSDVSAEHRRSLLKTTGIHSTTSEISKSINSQNKKWDWNTLPELGQSPLTQDGIYNIIRLHVDGETKDIKYDPKYNKRFPEMDIFLSFNRECETKDALMFSKKRILSYILYISKYLKANKSAPANSDTLLSSADSPGIQQIINLWNIQIQTYFTQTSAILFSAEVTQKLLSRKSVTRKPTGSVEKQDLLHMEPSKVDGVRVPLKSVVSNPLDEIDILLIRPAVTTEIGWELAYNEPNITVADYAINIEPWREFDDESNQKFLEFVESDKVKYSYNNHSVIVANENSITLLDRKNASDFIVDCMDRNIISGNPQHLRKEQPVTFNNNDDIISLTNSEKSFENNSSMKDMSDILSVKSLALQNTKYGADGLQQSSNHISSSRKKKNIKKSGFVNFFRRKHNSSVPIAPTLAANVSQSVSGTSSPKIHPSVSTPASAMFNPTVFESIDNQNFETLSNEDEPKNLWLEDYFSKTLSNYRRIIIPSQFYFPRKQKSVLSEKPPVSEMHFSKEKQSQESLNSNELLSQNLSINKGDYGRELLQFRLPFKTNSLPAILCPWLWTTLTRTKWGNLLREMKRSLEPEGYALAVVSDLRLSNSEYNEPGHFKTSTERNRAFDSLSIEAMSHGLHIYPTKHLARKFKECGFINIKTTILSLKAGDLKTEMGCINELAITTLWNLISKSQSNKTNPQTEIELNTLIERYINEHWDKVDNSAGCLRVLFVVGQKPENA